MSSEAGNELCCCGWGVHVAFCGPEGNSKSSVAVRGADILVGLTNKLSRVLKKFLSASVWHIYSFIIYFQHIVIINNRHGGVDCLPSHGI